MCFKLKTEMKKMASTNKQIKKKKKKTVLS